MSDFSAVREAFESNFQAGRECGAAVAVWQDGREVLSVQGGHCDAARSIPWTEETLVLFWSATKGLASACVLQAVDQAELTLDAPIRSFWPEFAAGGKGDFTLAHALSHRAGLAALRTPDVSIFDHDAVAAALAAQEPFPESLPGPAYGARTFGFVADEIVRRLTGGTTLGEFWRREIAEPLGLELWIGLPESEDFRVATMLPPRSAGPAEDPFLQAFNDPASLTRRAFAAPVGLASVSAMNKPNIRRLSLPSLGGIGTASSLAKFYSILACDGLWQGKRWFSDRVIGWMSRRLAQGHDAVLRKEVSFSAGFMMDPVDAVGGKLREVMGSTPSAFGHPGAGGSLAFADPQHGLGFAYVMNQMEPGVLPGPRAQCLVQALS